MGLSKKAAFQLCLSSIEHETGLSLESDLLLAFCYFPDIDELIHKNRLSHPPEYLLILLIKLVIDCLFA